MLFINMWILSILEISKMVMYEFWYDTDWYMDTGSLVTYIPTEDSYSHIAKDVEARFDTSNYELDRPLPKRKNKKVSWLIKDELGRNIMKGFATLEVKTHSYLTNNSDEDRKDKMRKKM